MIKPRFLKKGDKICALSLSWGGAGEYPDRYFSGKKKFEKAFGVEIVEGKHTLKGAKRIYNNPEARAQDLNNAFADTSINGIISTIGGDDSIRMLPYIDFDTIKRNPKVYMGFSDSTVSNFICYKSGLVSFSGPSIMAGFGELGGLYQYTYESLKRFIFSNKVVGELIENDGYRTNEKIEWSLKITEKRKANKSDGWRRIQGKGIVSGGLIGGCIEVFPMINGTSIWPDISVWKGKILFIETSEEKIKEDQYERIIRNLGSQGILHLINGILVGRSQIDYDSGIQINYDQSLLKVIRGEFNISGLPIITNMDFGHTDPMMVMPLGVDAKIDCDKKNILILENTCV